MNSFFTVFGKVMLVVLVIGLLIGGGVFIGLKFKSATPSPTPTAIFTPLPTQIETPTPTPTAPTFNTVSVTSAGGAFVSFKITVPSDWTTDTSQVAGAPKLTVTKANYQLIISQGAGGGASCLYPGDPSQDFAAMFNAPTLINSASGQFRRATAAAGSPAGTEVYTVCEQKPTGWGLPTQFGYITYNTPANPDTAILVMMDNMIASIKK